MECPFKPSHFIKLQISTSKNDTNFVEKRFPKDLTVAELKGKLELITGGNCHTMTVDVIDADDNFAAKLINDDSTLESYNVKDGMRLHITDKFLSTEVDLSDGVEKFTIDDEKYAKKDDTVKAFLMKHKLGHYNQDNIKKKELVMQAEKEALDRIIVGSRCCVAMTNALSRRGTVKYAGNVDGLSGYWVGVQYDEPLGKNDGSYNGKVYFKCPEKYGVFVKPHNVECGDFPEEDYDLNKEF